MPIRRTVCAILATAACALPVRAYADAIDGSWCHEPSQRLSIDGPAIVTPGGNAIKGEYSRHYFSYTVPSGEAPPGATMQLRLLNEQTMQMRAGPQAPVETWLRCSPATS
jgi:hypothetical protein